MKTKQTITMASALLGAMLASVAAQAATWTYSGTGPASDSGLSATAKAFSAANNSTATVTATTAYYGGGLGITTSGESTGSPHHAIDNNGAIETMLISFSDGVGGITTADKVNLSHVNIGWSYGDTDFSVYAYVGAATPTTTPEGLKYNNLTANSWQLIGHYNKGNTTHDGSGAAGSTGNFSITNSVYSSHWLIGAYNGLTTTSGADSSDDYFKLAAVSGDKCPTTGTIPAGCGGGGGPGGNVPEPGTLLLMGAGFLGLTRLSRRKSA
ncbi:MAG: exosortase-dependent surface protein XDP1 [Thiobacillus sp.]